MIGIEAEQAAGRSGETRLESPRPGVRVVIADDHAVLREALVAYLAATGQIEIAAEASNGEEALAAVERHSPDVLVLDISMPGGMDGLEIAARLRALGTKTRVVALSTHGDRHTVEQMLAAGADAYVVKSSGGEQLRQAILAAAAGKRFVCPDAARSLLHRFAETPGAKPPATASLSRREREVLALLSSGLRSGDIAKRLQIATATVEVHRRNIMRKLELHNVAELTKYAIREGLTAL